MLIDEFETLAPSERVTDMLHLIMCCQKMCHSLDEEYHKQCLTLLNEGNVDYSKYHREFSGFREAFESTIKELPVYIVQGERNYPLDELEIVEEENNRHSLVNAIDRINIYEARLSFVSYYDKIIAELHRELKLLAESLKKIAEEKNKQIKNEKYSLKILNCALDKYTEGKWQENGRRYCINRIVSQKQSTLDAKQNYQNAIDALIIENNDSLSRAYLDAPDQLEEVVRYILNNRDRLSASDLDNLFLLIKNKELLENRIRAIDDQQKPSGKYKDLFVSRAAEKLVIKLSSLLGPSLKGKGGYRYASFQVALESLGLIRQNKAKDMTDFINEYLISNPNDRIKTPNIISPDSRELRKGFFNPRKTVPLKALNLDHAHTEIHKEVGNLCLRFFNQVLHYDLKERLNDIDLIYPNPSVSVPDIMETFRDAELSEICYLSDVIRGEYDKF